MASWNRYYGCMAECCRQVCHCGSALQFYDDAAGSVMVEPDTEWEELAGDLGARPDHLECALKYASRPHAFIQGFVRRIGKEPMLADMWAFRFRCVS